MRCFDKNPATRPSSDQLLQHPWLQDVPTGDDPDVRACFAVHQSARTPPSAFISFPTGNSLQPPSQSSNSSSNHNSQPSQEGKGHERRPSAGGTRSQPTVVPQGKCDCCLQTDAKDIFVCEVCAKSICGLCINRCLVSSFKKELILKFSNLIFVATKQFILYLNYLFPNIYIYLDENFKVCPCRLIISLSDRRRKCHKCAGRPSCPLVKTNSMSNVREKPRVETASYSPSYSPSSSPSPSPSSTSESTKPKWQSRRSINLKEEEEAAMSLNSISSCDSSQTVQKRGKGHGSFLTTEHRTSSIFEQTPPSPTKSHSPSPTKSHSPPSTRSHSPTRSTPSIVQSSSPSKSHSPSPRRSRSPRQRRKSRPLSELGTGEEKGVRGRPVERKATYTPKAGPHHMVLHTFKVRCSQLSDKLCAFNFKLALLLTCNFYRNRPGVSTAVLSCGVLFTKAVNVIIVQVDSSSYAQQSMCTSLLSLIAAFLQTAFFAMTAQRGKNPPWGAHLRCLS